MRRLPFGILAALLLIACSGSTPPASTSTSASGVASTGASATGGPPPSPVPTATVTHGRAVGLTGGDTELFGSTISTAPIRPSKHDSVIVSVLSLNSSNAIPAVAPTLSGGGAHWRTLATTQKKAGASRGMTVFGADHVGPGPLTFTFPPSAKTAVCWTVVAAPGSVLRTVIDVSGDLETSHSVGIDGPTGIVLAIFGIGQQEPLQVEPPFQQLEQVHTASPGATCVTAWSRSPRATVRWGQPGHAMAAAVEVG